MRFDAELLLLAMAPVFVGCIGWEAWHLSRAQPDSGIYSWRDTLCNAALALMHQAADKVAWLFVIPVYAFFYAHFRLFTLQPGWASFVLLFVAQDLLYYAFHRASHRVRWLWAAHVVHHSSERLNLSTAFRQSLMYRSQACGSSGFRSRYSAFLRRRSSRSCSSISPSSSSCTRRPSASWAARIRLQYAVDPSCTSRAQRPLHRP